MSEQWKNVLTCRSYKRVLNTHLPTVSVPCGSGSGSLPDAAEGPLFPLRDAPGPDSPAGHTYHRGPLGNTFTGEHYHARYFLVQKSTASQRDVVIIAACSLSIL